MGRADGRHYAFRSELVLFPALGSLRFLIQADRASRSYLITLLSPSRSCSSLLAKYASRPSLIILPVLVGHAFRSGSRRRRASSFVILPARVASAASSQEKQLSKFMVLAVGKKPFREISNPLVFASLTFTGTLYRLAILLSSKYEIWQALPGNGKAKHIGETPIVS